MRNKYSKEFEEYARANACNFTKEQLMVKLQRKFNIYFTKSTFEKYLYRHKIQCKDYNKNMARSEKNTHKAPIGAEYVKPDGMVLIKVAQPNVWEYKQRVIYQNHYKCKLTTNDYIIFLDQNRNNFDINNLKKITKKESAYLSNKQMFSKNPHLTNLGILTAKLMIKAKEKTMEEKYG